MTGDLHGEEDSYYIKHASCKHQLLDTLAVTEEREGTF